MSLIGLLGRGFGVIEPQDPVIPQTAGPVQPESSSVIGCTDPKQQATYIIPASFGSSIAWTVRDDEGNPIEVEGSPEDGDLTEKYGRIALFHNPFCGNDIYLGYLQADGNGGLTVIPHQMVTDRPGIYEMEVHWSVPQEGGDDLHYYNTAVVSFEQSIFNRAYLRHHKGPLPLSRIRQRLRDYANLNDVTQAMEFSAEEILSAMLEPVEYYNETPPHIKVYSPDTFPFRQHWLDATISRLLLTGGIWLERNDVSIKAEGISSNDRDHAKTWLNMAQTMWTEYRQFVYTQKAGENMKRGFRVI